MKKNFFIFSIFSVISFIPLCGMEKVAEKVIDVTTPGVILALQQQREKLTDALDGGLKVSKFMILTGPLAILINDYSRKKEQASELTVKLSEYKQKMLTSTIEQMNAIAEFCTENLPSLESWEKVAQSYKQLIEKNQEISEETCNDIIFEVTRPMLKALPQIADKLKPFHEKEQKIQSEFKKEIGYNPELFDNDTEITPKIYISSLNDETVSNLCKELNL